VVKRRRQQEQDERVAHEQAETRREALLAELRARLGPGQPTEAEAPAEAGAAEVPAADPSGAEGEAPPAEDS
jgi:hypothetical protein